MQTKTKEETKQDAIREWVAREFNAVPQGWVQIILEHDCEYAPLPMWGCMWRVDEYTGCKLWDSSRVMLSGVDELRDEIGQGENSNYSEDERAALEQAIESNDWPMLERYIDEEMCGARCILDNEGNPTAAYIYLIAGEYVMGVNGAGWNFYDGVWDRLYDVCGIRWHEYANA